ncbi:MAG: methylenetetrahydrofolate reductase [NAD(P)H] [Solirubrobacteraceae bacterium]|jgi:methylenetetrahydrofolate reductase (NADPH)
MRIDTMFARRSGPLFSFEFFPPVTEAGERNLFSAVAALRELEPSFVSVTKTGATTQQRTIELVSRIRDEHEIEAMAHFTCGGADIAELRACLDQLCDAGFENVLTLRGDPPRDADAFVVTEGGLRYASELTALVSAEYPLCPVAACHPETHPEAQDAESDLRHLKVKVEAGARVLISNLFFDNAAYFAFVERARAAGIDVPIVPGIMPIGSAEQIKRFTSICGATIPAPLLRALDARGDDSEAVADLGVAYATLQCAELLAAGAPGIHFYTLNRSPATRAILSALRLTRPWEAAQR